jgi:uncharacterized protein
MKQAWTDLLFLHWPIGIEDIRYKIHPHLEIDTFDGQPWLGITPFMLKKLRIRGTPAVPGLSEFAEINVRTYVHYQGKSGVWFFSLDAASLQALIGGRLLQHLPYFYAKGHINSEAEYFYFESRRLTKKPPQACMKVRYRPTSDPFQADPDSLEAWLTERYSLYCQDQKGNLYRSDVHHMPWTLHQAEAVIEENTMASASGISLPETPPLIHFSVGVEATIWPLKTVFKPHAMADSRWTDQRSSRRPDN